MNNKKLYGIMMKYPEPGRVKTRLAKDIGQDKAAFICRQMTERVIRRTIPIAGEYGRFIFYDPPERVQDFKLWFPNEKLITQKGSDVGARMGNAIRYMLENRAEKTVITGTDIPDINRIIIAQAFEILSHKDIVIGPAHDGGYYLIGMKTPIPELFQGITWSAGNVFSETVNIIKLLNKSYGTVPVLSDIDTIEDLRHIVK